MISNISSVRSGVLGGILAAGSLLLALPALAQNTAPPMSGQGMMGAAGMTVPVSDDNGNGTAPGWHGYGPGYGYMGGYGMGPGMMGGYGGWGRMQGYGMGPYHGSWHGMAPYGYGMGPGHMGGYPGQGWGMMGGYGMGPGMMWGLVSPQATAALGLSDDQSQKLATILQKHEEKMLKAAGDLRVKQFDLMQALHQQQPDMGAVKKAYDEVAAERRKLFLDAVEARVKMRSVLNDEQRKRWDEWQGWDQDWE